MSEQGPAIQPEMLLDEWLRERDPEHARRQLDLLVTQHLAPVVRRIVGFKLTQPRSDVEDVSQEALCNVLARLERMKNAGDGAAVRDLASYAAVTAYNACNEYYRSRRPIWLSLSMKVRYMATHSPRFALWRTEDGREACGFAVDRGQEPISDTAALQQGCEELRRRVDASRLSIAELLAELLNAAGRPISFEVLVDLAAELSGALEDKFRPAERTRLRDSTPPADAQLIRRSFLQRVWKEIRELSLEHRKALLLNLNDSAGGDIRLFDALGIASIRQIAEVLEMPPIEFAALWKELPLNDARIAELLGITRLDVSNRRSAARKRLTRRLREADRDI
jgi:RNA polymerase sigma factor (sigma-70 family)